MRIVLRLPWLLLPLIAACGSDPVVTPPAALAIQTAALANGVAGTDYSATVAATGGSGEGYRWTVASGALPGGVVLREAGTPSTVVSGTSDTAGRFTFALAVVDSAGARAERSYTLEITDAKEPLELVTTTLADATVGTAYTAQVVARNGNNAGYTWTVSAGSLPGGLTLSASGTPAATISGTPTAAGSFSFTISVEDDEGGTAEGVFALEVADAPPPALRVVTTLLPTGFVGRAYTQSITASGGTDGYSWSVVSGTLPPGLTLATDGTPATTLSGTPTDMGTFDFEVEVRDAGDRTARASLSIAIGRAPPPLGITPRTLPDGTERELYSTNVTASGGSQLGYTWSVSAGALPDGLTVTEDATPATTISGTPTAAGTHTFTLHVTDSAANEAELEMTIAIAAGIVPVQISTQSVPPGAVGTVYSATLDTVAGTGSGMSYNWVVSSGAIPPGLTLGQNGTPSTTISGTPIAGGQFTATIMVFDSNNTSDSASYNFDIAQPLAVATSSTPIAQAGTPYLTTVRAIGGSEMGHVWSISQGSLPDGLTLASSGTPASTISGTPTQSGNFPFTVQVTDDAGGVATRSLTITVVAGLTIETLALPNGRRGIAYTADIAAVGGTSTGYTWTVVAGALPAGLTLTPAATPIATISGTPTAPGTFGFTVQVTDSGGETDSVIYSIDIEESDVWVAWVGDTRVDAITEISVVRVDGPTPGAPVVVNPIIPGGGGVTSERYTRLSPDGTKIAFRGDFRTDGLTELFVVDLSGPTPGAAQVVNGTLVTGGAITEFLWSPDSTRIVYQADEQTDAVPELFMVDVSGPVPTGHVKVSGPMVAGGFVQSQDFDWSPDGSKIAYQADQMVDNVMDVYVVDVGGLVPGPAQRVNTLLDPAADLEDHWVWTPDGTRIIFVGDQDVVNTIEVYIVDVSQAVPSAPIKLNGAMVSGGNVSLTDDDVRVSPDGDWVSYVADQDTNGIEELYVVNIQGAVPSAPIKVSGPMMSFSDTLISRWSPDSTKLAYVADQEVTSRYEVYMVDMSTSPPGVAVKIHPSFPDFGRVAAGDAMNFSPDSAWIAYRADVLLDNAFEVLVVDVSGPTFGVPVRTAPPVTLAQDIDEFIFSPDSRFIAVRGDATVTANDEAFVMALSGPTAGMPVSVTGVPVTGGAVSDLLWLGDGQRLYVRGDLRMDNDIEAFLIDVEAPIFPPPALNAPLPTGGDVSTLILRQR